MDSTRSFLWIATVGLVSALVTSNLVAYYRIRHAAARVVEGEARVIARSLRTLLRDLGPRPEPAELADLLETEGPTPLTYLALVPTDGGPEVEAGRGALPAPGGEPGRKDIELRVDGARARVHLGGRGWLRGRRRRFGARGVGPPRGNLGGRGLRRRAPFSAVRFEFHSHLARDMRASGVQNLWIGAFSGLAFLGCAAYLARLLDERAAAEAREAQRERLAALGELSAVMAHEIRTPLTSLKGTGQLLAEGAPEAGPLRKKADRIVRQVARLERLVHDLLDFARVGAVSRREADPVALVREVGAEDPGATPLTVAADSAPASWSLDPDRMRQVLRNLIQNARQANPPGEAVEVAVDVHRGRLRIRVCDRGPGIAEADLPRIFEPFVTRKANGTGLGLAVSRRLVELHGGELTAANRAGGGARFTAAVPPGPGAGA